MDRPTVEVYEREARRWTTARGPGDLGAVQAFRARADAAAAAAGEQRPVVDLGCGPGWHTVHLGPGAVALDAAAAMLALVPERSPAAPRVRADLAALPFGRGSLGGAWASKSYVHVPATALPVALADLHRALAVGAPLELVVFRGDVEFAAYADDDVPGRRFSGWSPDRLRDVLEGAGFTVEDISIGGDEPGSRIAVRAVRARTLADTVGPGMRVLVCGLNPSLYAADAGVGFARPGNRFWPAARAAGLVTAPVAGPGLGADPFAVLRVDGIGMTDLVKRASARADDLTAEEYRDGLARVTRLVEWLRPAAVCFVGLAGWRAVVDRRAVAGRQPTGLAGAPVHVVPSTSGANASSRLEDLTEALRSVAAATGR